MLRGQSNLCDLLTRPLRDKRDLCLVPSSPVVLHSFPSLLNVMEYTFTDVRGRDCRQVNEPDQTVVPVEIQKVDDANDVVGDKAPIRREVNGDVDVEGATSGGSEGVDLVPADQSLVGELSQDADTSVIQEIPVRGIPVLGTPSPLLVRFWGFDALPCFSLPLFCVGAFFARSSRVLCSSRSSIRSLCDRMFPSRSPTPMPGRRSWLRKMRVMSFPSPSTSGRMNPLPWKVCHPLYSILQRYSRPTEPAVEEKEETEIVIVPPPLSSEPIVEPTELAGGAPPVAENDSPNKPKTTPAEPVIADLDSAKEVESHAAELEVAPEPIETVTAVLGAALCAFFRG